MRRALSLVVAGSAVLVSLPLCAAPTEVGDLQVTCRPGYRLYIDGAFVGLTVSEEDGRYLRGVASGRHVLRVEKLGFEPRELQVDVPSGGAVEVKVGELAPEGGPPAPTDTSSPPPGAAAPTPEATRREVGPPVAAVATPPVADAARDSGEVAAAPPALPPDDSSAPAVATAGPGPPMPVALPSPAVTMAAEVGRGVGFTYRAAGAALSGIDAPRSSVSIYRERGGPRSPALIFLCSGEARCEERTKEPLEPGRYLFRVTFRSWAEGSRGEEPLFGKDMRVEIEARPGHTYVIAATYAATTADACRVAVEELP
jgi:hypothetical protein